MAVIDGKIIELQSLTPMDWGPKSLMKDLGQDMPIRVWTDSSAAIGICTRQGLGKLRHIDTHTHTHLL